MYRTRPLALPALDQPPPVVLILSPPRPHAVLLFFFYNDPAPPDIYPLPLHDPLPLSFSVLGRPVFRWVSALALPPRGIAVNPCGPPFLNRAGGAVAVLEKLDVSTLIPFEARQ